MYRKFVKMQHRHRRIMGIKKAMLMKKRNWLQLLLIILFIAAFWQYRRFDAAHTDIQAPELRMDGTQVLEVSVTDPRSALLQGVSAWDQRDGDLTDKVVVEGIQLSDDSGMIAVDYAVSDRSGNVVKATREARYTDYTSPRFTLSQPLIFQEHASFDIMNTVGAVDVLDGDIQHRVRAMTLTEEPITSLGTHQIYLQVNNSVNDMSELIVPLEVLDSNRYDAELTLTDYLVYLPVGARFRAENYLKEFTHRDETVSLQQGIPADYTVNISGNVATEEEGVYIVTYKVSYIVRHAQNPEYDQTFTGYSKLIVVVEG